MRCKARPARRGPLRGGVAARLLPPAFHAWLRSDAGQVPGALVDFPLALLAVCGPFFEPLLADYGLFRQSFPDLEAGTIPAGAARIGARGAAHQGQWRRSDSHQPSERRKKTAEAVDTRRGLARRRRPQRPSTVTLPPFTSGLPYPPRPGSAKHARC